MIALGVVCVLLVAQIDLSVGSVSGLAAAIVAVSFDQLDWPLALAILAALGARRRHRVGLRFLYTRFGVPSFVITLAGLLGFLGLQLWVLGRPAPSTCPSTPGPRPVRAADVPARVAVLLPWRSSRPLAT